MLHTASCVAVLRSFERSGGVSNKYTPAVNSPLLTRKHISRHFPIIKHTVYGCRQTQARSSLLAFVQVICENNCLERRSLQGGDTFFGTTPALADVSLNVATRADIPWQGESKEKRAEWMKTLSQKITRRPFAFVRHLAMLRSLYKCVTLVINIV